MRKIDGIHCLNQQYFGALIDFRSRMIPVLAGRSELWSNVANRFPNVSERDQRFHASGCSTFLGDAWSRSRLWQVEIRNQFLTLINIYIFFLHCVEGANFSVFIIFEISSSREREACEIKVVDYFV